MKLENKVAIVTGGGKGIGAEICLRLAKEGAKIVIEIGRAHVRTPVTEKSRMPSSA